MPWHMCHESNLCPCSGEAWSPNHWWQRTPQKKHLILSEAKIWPCLQFKLCSSSRGIILPPGSDGSWPTLMITAWEHQLPLWRVVWEQCRQNCTGQTELPFHLPGWSFRLEPRRKSFFWGPFCPPPADISGQILMPSLGSISLSAKGEIGTPCLIKFFSYFREFSALFFLKGMNRDIFKPFPTTIHRPVTEGRDNHHYL